MSIKAVWGLSPLLIFLVVLGLKTTAMAQDEPLAFDAPITSSLEGGQAQVWTFEGEAGQGIHLSAERFPPNPDSQLDPLLELYDAAGNLLASADNGSVGQDAFISNYVLPVTGAYSVKVSNLTTWAGGSYQLTLTTAEYPAGCQSPQGEMLRGEMPSLINGYPVRYRIFMPPCYEGKRYPYIILGHGSNSSDEHWDALGIDEAITRGVALKRLPPMAVVLAWGGELANTNTFREGASWEYVVIDELIPYVEANYCLAGERAIGGISRGGFWAFEIAFRHPALFVSLGGHSPFFDLYHAPPSHNPLDLIMAPPPNPPLRIWIDRGKNDYAQVNIDLAHERLLANQISHEFQLYEVGEHENAYWQAHLDDYLQFYSQGFYGDEWDIAQLSDCP